MKKMLSIRTSRELKYYRKLLGWSQRELAHRAQCHVQTVKNWEGKRGFVQGRMIHRFGAIFGEPETLERLRSAALPKAPPLTCGAKTRKGTPCRAKPLTNRRRCKFHGGMSTGPKTIEGRQRISRAMRVRRWSEERQKAPT